MEVVASLSQVRTAAAQCGLFTHKSVPVILEPPCKNEISRNLGKYFKAVPQITLHDLHCNLIIVLTKPKHVATLLKQSNYFNYSVVMSDCLSLFVFIHTIYRAVHLTNFYLSIYTEKQSLLQRQSLLFNPVRLLKHVFSVITEHLVLATHFTHQQFSELFIGHGKFVLLPHCTQHRPTANWYQRYDSQLR